MKNTTEAKKEEMIREIRFLFEQIIWTMHSYDPKSDYISLNYDNGRVTIKTNGWSRTE